MSDVTVEEPTLTLVSEPQKRAPLGGTELILANLKKALPELTDKVQIIMSRPENVALEDKPRILWLQDLPQDPASQCLKDPGFRSRFNRIVFASHWQQQQYNLFLQIPFGEGLVIKNAVPRLTPTLPKGYGENGKLRFIYTSTPHRGLQLLAAAADALVKERQDWELHVYSSLKIYGWDEADKQFEPLYDLLRKNPCVVYHGSVSNEEARQAVKDAHVWVYPSIYAETSCMSAMEAMMAGCLAITTSFGALPETCAEWAWMFSVHEQAQVMAERTHLAMRQALDSYSTPSIQARLEAQTDYYQTFWSFEARVPQWKALLEQVIAEGPKQEMLVIE